jgi:hypothetical protein
MNKWKLVPVEPTGRQLDYAMAACSKLTPLNVHNVYRAMLAVAPPAPSAEQPDHTALLRQALEALEERYIGALRDNAIDALRKALEEK